MNFDGAYIVDLDMILSLYLTLPPFAPNILYKFPLGHLLFCADSVAKLAEQQNTFWSEAPQNDLASSQCKYHDKVDKYVFLLRD